MDTLRSYAQNVRNSPEKRKTLKRTLKVLMFGLLGFYLYDPLVNFAIDWQLQLKDGGLVTSVWKAVPLPINSCWYIWGIENPGDFLAGAKPKMVEHGPFCYFMYRKRRILEWKEQTVLFMERYEFKFNPKGSKPLDTEIQSVNAPILTGVLFAKNLLEGFYLNFVGPVLYNAINMMLTSTGESLVEVFTARQLMEGRRMRLIQYADMMLAPVRMFGVKGLNFEEGSMGIFNHSFGITTSIPFFELGPYEAYLKSGEEQTVGHIRQFEGRNTYPEFKSPCNRVAGGDGMFFSRPVEARQLDVFVQHTCRILPFVRNESHVLAGTKVVRYNMDPEMFDITKPENQCYCLKNKPFEDCDGWADMSPCVLGLPLGFSFPHFLHSPRRQEELDGLNPIAAKHNGFLEVEDNLGAPVWASMTIQAVLDVKPVWSVSSLAALPSVKLPIIWVDLVGGAEGPLSAGLAVISNTVRYGSYGVLLAFLLYAGILILRTRNIRGTQQERQGSESGSTARIYPQPVEPDVQSISSNNIA